MAKRLTLLDKLNLRTTSVYASPREITALRIPYGDISHVQIPCTQIDADSRVYHISDVPIQLISGTYADGELQTYGCKAYTAYQDETGRAIACVVFDNPQYEKKITVACKGAIDLSTGNLIENPADFIEHELLTVQGYDAASIDTAEIARFYSICLKQGIRIGYLLGDASMYVKTLMDLLAFNIHAHWNLSDGKCVARVRNVASSGVAYPFTEAEITGLRMTSEDLINEITLNFNYDPAQGKYLSSITKHNPVSKRVNEAVRESYDCPMLYATRQAERTIDSMLKSYAFPSIISSFRHNIKSVRVEVGDPCTITHAAGIGANGFAASPAMVISKDAITHEYSIMIDKDATLYDTELLNLTSVAAGGASGVSVIYANGVATLTIYADVQGNPPIQGAEVTINGVKKITDTKGQARFNLNPGRYSAVIEASGYENAEITFTV
jgi:hypothetical protein